MQLNCDKDNCLCHHLCPSGHYVDNKDKCLLGCTYFPFLSSIHRPLIENKSYELCLCNGVCGASRSGGMVTVKYRNGQLNKW